MPAESRPQFCPGKQGRSRVSPTNCLAGQAALTTRGMSPLQRALLCVLTMPDASISKGHCCRKWYDICSRQACCTWHTSIVQHKPTSLLRLRPFPMKGASALVSNWSERLASRAGMLLHASHASHASGQSGQQASTLSASTAHGPCITGHWCA